VPSPLPHRVLVRVGRVVYRQLLRHMRSWYCQKVARTESDALKTNLELAAVYRAMDKDDILQHHSNKVRDVWVAFCGGGLMSAVGFAMFARTLRSHGSSNSDQASTPRNAGARTMAAVNYEDSRGLE